MYLYMLSVYIRELSLKKRGKVVDIPRHEASRYISTCSAVHRP